ncbi:non-ribosomal peptide synthetase [Nocardiopsis sp. RV163]|uniref:non-ribosomal peptide synthetase n=1 Tax=Nocardiopsis sp. RV163 TaxID=1661388 RepID=UPI00064BFD42|nr:non-ribosomal peptide synthetase [Nocardiopsis sp. RV163]
MATDSITRRFGAQVERTPDAIAVSSGGTDLTYLELDQHSDRIARGLRVLGVGARTPVAVLMSRSADLVAVTLAVLKAGGHYVPLHEGHPVERLAEVVCDSGARILVTDVSPGGGGVPACETVTDVRALTRAAEEVRGPGQGGTAPPEEGPGRTAYLMYTSGSTGAPKGVAVTHGGVLGLVDDGCWEGNAHERVLMVAPYAFSVSSYELWVPLLRGGTVVTAPPGPVDVSTLRRLVSEKGITGLHLTAGLFRVLAEEAPESLRGVREVLTGGDIVSSRAVRRVLEAAPGTVVRATYGATELTLFALTMRMASVEDVDDVVPAGHCMDGTYVYVLDSALRPVATGTVGELYVSSDRLARGYHRRPDLTAQRFVADPFRGSARRMYRTGDLVRRRSNGVVEFLGRADLQVKIRGFRVEPAEVEAVLARFPGVAHAAVTPHDDPSGSRSLTAHVVAERGGPPLDVAGLQEHTRRLLPDYMVPSTFIVLDSLPLTPNGKVDRRALPKAASPSAAPERRGPRNRAEELLCSLFADVLDVPDVGVTDDFFDLGGQSLLAMRLLSRLESATGVDLPVKVLFDSPTAESLSRHVLSHSAWSENTAVSA